MPSQRIKRFLLPFTVSAKDREKPFTKEMEMAAALCLAEMERKSGGHILRGRAEELVFIAEAGYPLWLVPWKRRSLLFDGLGVMAHTLSYEVLPDIKVFINDVEGSRTKEAYSATLSDLRNYFHDFIGVEEKKIEGLIETPSLLQDFALYFPRAKPIRTPKLNSVFLSPTIDESEISSLMHELLDQRAALMDEIKILHKTMKLLSATTRNEAKAVRVRIGEIRKEFNEKIATVKPSIMKKIRKIQERYDQKITKLSKEIEAQLHNLHREHLELEKTSQQLAVKIERCEVERRSCRLQKDEAGELRWKEELEKCRKELSPLDKSIKDLNKKIEAVSASKNLKVSKIRSEYDSKADKELKTLRELETSREAKLRIYQQEMESLKNLTSEIISQIDKLAKLKKAVLDKFEGMGIPKRRRKYALIYLPFYLTCYMTKLEKRYVIYPPSVAGSVGILTKFKGVFGVARIKSLLQHRSTPITELLNQLVILIQNNPVFEREIIDAGIKANILRTKESREKIKKGLIKLRDEEWISEGEFQNLANY